MDEREIFLQVIQVDDPAAREELLRRVTANDASLRYRVESLLEVHDRAGGFLESPPSNVCATIDQPGTECVGTLIGPYKLLEQIGEGGMDLVYMAEQQRPMRRLVALKLIKPGMDSKQVIARFEAEKQALAMMDHENIAKVFEAGTTDTGRFYFAMELVRGIPINEFCDQKRLSVRERLALFIQVCQAVQHAHQKGIIHRDLKPSNVLVTMHDVLAVPKVIDFGIAKALGQQLTEHTLHTGFAQLVGTPLYMSPEQAEMNQLGVDTRSDVYSLGVLLYELLTGTTPFDKETLSKAGLDEMRRMIREDDPLRPSVRLSTLQAPALSTISQRRSTDPRRISATLRGELDWIVMKALEKDRSRRYESASAFATDIQRYLSDEPVLACPPTTMYRFQKFARKHKPALATAAAIAVCLLLGTTVSAWQAVRATTAEAQANANEAQAKAAAAAEAQQRQRAEANEQKATTQRDEVKALNEQLRRTLYASNMNLAHNAWDAGAIERVQDLLSQHRPKPGEADLRGFEWYYLSRLGRSELLTLNVHTGFVWCVVFSPDGKRLASGRDGTLKVWDAQSGQELLSLKGHTGRNDRSISFSPDSKRLAAGSGVWDDVKKNYATKEVKVWDAQTGQELLSLKEQSSVVNSVAFSPDGKRLASTSADKTMRVCDAQTGQELLSQKNAGETVIFSPDGKRLVSPNDKVVKVIDAQTGQELLAIKGGANSVAYSPDGKRLATAGGEDQTIKVWDADTGQELMACKGHAGQQINSVAFSPDSKRIVSGGGDRAVKAWDAQTGEELFTFRGHTNMVWSVTYSPDGNRLASAGLEGTVKVWDATTSPDARTLSGLTGSVTSMAFSPDGKSVAVSYGIWDEAKQAYIAVKLKLLNAQSGQELLSLEGHTGGVFNLAFSPDSKSLASGSQDNMLKVWDTQSGRELLSFTGRTSKGLAFSPDGKRLASGCDDNTAKVWDAQTGQELLVFKGHSFRVNGLAFSPDGKRLASSSGDKTVKVWDAQTGQELLSLRGHAGLSSSVAFSPDGKRLASVINVGPGGVGEIKLSDANTGEELFSLKGHTAQVSSVVFSPDGKRLASASGNPTGGQSGEVKVWDSQTGQDLRSNGRAMVIASLLAPMATGWPVLLAAPS